MNKMFLIVFLIFPSTCLAIQKAGSVLVIKAESRLYLVKAGVRYREFKVVFGKNPVGHKRNEGDERTPEGRYLLDYKNATSSFYKSIHISYPNEDDIARAKSLGVDPGGMIMIHGQKNGFGWLGWFMQLFNWTDGCIAVTNHEMDEIWDAVDPGIPIEITP